jgi:hypothetical protein
VAPISPGELSSQAVSQTSKTLTRPGGSSWFLRDGGPCCQAGLGGLKEGLGAGGCAG